jgi:hypothetical protein
MSLPFDEKLLLERVLRHLLPDSITPLVHPEKRAIAVFGEEHPQNTMEFFTPTEWALLLVLAEAYPQYAPYEWLLQGLYSYSLEQARQMVLAASSARARHGLLKPIHRALSHLRSKLRALHANVNISHVYEAGYALISPAPPWA